MDFPQDTRLHDFVARQAKATPDATAVVCGEEALTYRELNARANQLAHYLLQRGAGPDVLGRGSLRTVCRDAGGILGVLKSGSAYVPLDPIYPRERIRHILEDSRAPLVLTQDPSWAICRTSVASDPWTETGRLSRRSPARNR